MMDFENTTKADLICMDSRAFYAMFNELVEKIKQVNSVQYDPWISTDEAMHLLRITSKATLKKFCDDSSIKFAILSSKLILYNRDSILDFIEKQSK